MRRGFHGPSAMIAVTINNRKSARGPMLQSLPTIPLESAVSWYGAILRDVRLLGEEKAALALSDLFHSIERQRHSGANSIQWFMVVALTAFVVARTEKAPNIDARARLERFVSENRDLLSI